MIYTHKYFEANNLPKYLKNVAAILKKAADSVFYCKKDIETIKNMITKQLEKDKPKNSMAHVELYKEFRGGKGGIYVYLRHDSDNNAVLRLSWQELQCVLDYDKNVDDFFDISDEVENLFTKGGEA
ncbi:MAG: hypothetical protein ACI3YG_09615 [Prevotella sp.]